MAAPVRLTVTLAGIVLYRTWRVHHVPAGDVTDDLTGPVSANLTIPFQASAMTPEGLLRHDAADERSGYLFLGNSAEGTIFNNVSVRPRG